MTAISSVNTPAIYKDYSPKNPGKITGTPPCPQKSTPSQNSILNTKAVTGTHRKPITPPASQVLPFEKLKPELDKIFLKWKKESNGAKSETEKLEIEQKYNKIFLAKLALPQSQQNKIKLDYITDYSKPPWSERLCRSLEKGLENFFETIDNYEIGDYSYPNKVQSLEEMEKDLKDLKNIKNNFLKNPLALNQVELNVKILKIIQRVFPYYQYFMSGLDLLDSIEQGFKLLIFHPHTDKSIKTYIPNDKVQLNFINSMFSPKVLAPGTYTVTNFPLGNYYSSQGEYINMCRLEQSNHHLITPFMQALSAKNENIPKYFDLDIDWLQKYPLDVYDSNPVKIGLTIDFIGNRRPIDEHFIKSFKIYNS